MSRGESQDSRNFGFIARFVEVCGSDEPAKIQRSFNISYQAAKNYLNGRLPDSRVLLLIAERSPYSIHWLLTGTGPKFVSSDRSGDIPHLARQIGELIRQEVDRAISEKDAATLTDQPRIVVLNASDVKVEKPKADKLAERN